MHGVCGDPADFCVSTRGAGAGGLALAVEGPSKAEIGCQDNKDGTVNVSYLPTAPGEYKVGESNNGFAKRVCLRFCEFCFCLPPLAGIPCKFSQPGVQSFGDPCMYAFVG